jgi:mannosyltransferase
MRLSRLPAGTATVALVTAVGVAVRLYDLGDKPLWLDEAYSYDYAQRSLGELWSPFAPVDMHPPLYYVLLGAWLQLGNSETWLRLPSAVVSAAAVVPTYLAARLLTDRRAAAVAGLLVALSPFQVWYAQEARMYGLLVFVAALLCWATARLLTTSDPPTWASVLYAGAGGVALLVHTSSVFLVGAAALVLLVTRAVSWRRWLVLHIAQLALWSMWLPGAVRQAVSGRGSSWLLPPSPTDVATVIGSPLTLTGATGTAGVVAIALLVLALGLAGASVLGARARVWGLGLWLLPLVAAYVVSVWRPVFLDRTLLWTVVPFAVLAGAAVARIRVAPVQAAALALPVAVSLFSLSYWYGGYEKEGWDDAAALVRAGAQPGDLIVYSGPSMRLPFEYYYRSPEQPRLGVAPPAPGDEDAVAAKARRYERVWLVYSHTASGDPAGVVPRALADGRRLGADTAFPGVRILRFDPA